MVAVGGLFESVGELRLPLAEEDFLLEFDVEAEHDDGD
jgi:hypothetical protein